MLLSHLHSWEATLVSFVQILSRLISPPRCFQPAPYFIAFKSVPLVNVVTVHNLTSVADCLCVLLYDICTRQALLSETVICQG